MTDLKLKAEDLIFELLSNEKYSAINELMDKIRGFGLINDISRYRNAVIEREKEHTTGIGCGIAVAHGKSREVDSLFMALGVSENGIEFGSCDGKPIQLLFLVSNPPEMESEYLEGSASRHNFFIPPLSSPVSITTRSSDR